MAIMRHLFHSTSSTLCRAGNDQAMHTRLRLVLLLASLFVWSWPDALRAKQIEQIPPAPSSSSFLLVASQQMADLRFRQTVILVTRHGNTGPIGVIINRPQAIKLDMIFPAFPAAKEFSLFDGGPVYPKQISYLVRGADAVEGALKISGNVYLAYDSSVLGEFLNGKRHYTGLRVMHGLASWAPGQLEHEINRGDWLVIPLDEAVIFDRPPAEMWQELQSHAAVM
jgi:putative transcriptional regulator